MPYRLRVVWKSKIKLDEYYEDDALAINWVLERLTLAAKHPYKNISDITFLIEELNNKLNADFDGWYYLNLPRNMDFYQPDALDKHSNIISLPIKEIKSLDLLLWANSSKRSTEVPEGVELISENNEKGLKVGWIEPVKK